MSEQQPEWSPALAEVMCLACPSRDSFLCSGLEDHELKHLAARATRFNLKKGKSLILEGDPSDNVYNIIEGEVVLSRLSSDGRRQILGFLSQGDFIGLTLSETYTFSADALSNSRLCRFDRQSLNELVERFPGMDRQIRRMGAAAVDAMLEHVFALGRKTAEERVTSFLIELSHKQGQCKRPTKYIKLLMTRGDIADYLGLTLETVSRILSRLKARRVIRMMSISEIEILEPETLISLADAETA